MKSLLFSVLALFLTINVAAQQINLTNTTLETKTVVQDLHVPWEILWGPDNWIWFTERDGTISRANPENGQVIELIAIDDAHEQVESGVLGLALHPQFEAFPYVYVVYTYLGATSIEERLVRYTYTGQSLTAPFTLIEGIKGNTTHDGSRLVILPDLTIIMSTGDAQNQAASQDVNALTGKFLRLNLDGTIPADNPIAGNPMWSYGHRNAQGLVLGSNGILYSSEHGPNNDDELNIIEMGANYGWPEVHGFCDGFFENMFCASNPVVEPLVAWTPTLAVAGIDYYNHPLIPEWQNSVLMTTLKDRAFFHLPLTPDGLDISAQNIHLDNVFGRFRDVCIAPDGRVFIATSNDDGRGTVQIGDDRIIQLSKPPVLVKVRTRLQGPHNSDTNLMNTDLYTCDLMPLEHPYARPPWNYQGTEAVKSVSDLPSNVVDWVLVEVRDANDNTIVLETRAAFLLENGEVVDIDGISSGVNFYLLDSNVSYFVVLRHRNHLDVITANAVQLPNATHINLSNPSEVLGGANQLGVLEGGGRAMKAGDFNADGTITIIDFNLYQTQASLINQYIDGDANLDKSVTVIDFNYYQPNASAIGVTQIRY